MGAALISVSYSVLPNNLMDHHKDVLTITCTVQCMCSQRYTITCNRPQRSIKDNQLLDVLLSVVHQLAHLL